MTNEFKPRALRATGFLVLDLFTATIGPAIVEAEIGRFRSARAIIIKEWFLSVTLAALMGYLMYRTWKSSTSKWVWVPTALWFGFAAIAYSGRLFPNSVLLKGNGFWTHFSGESCGVERASCIDFYAFVVPLIRGVSYSAGAWFASQTLQSHSSNHAPSDDPKTTSNEKVAST